jgi:hypothetical protein
MHVLATTMAAARRSKRPWMAGSKNETRTLDEACDGCECLCLCDRYGAKVRQAAEGAYVIPILAQV